MGSYRGISATMFGEPEYRTTLDLVMAIYLLTQGDMAGVCPTRDRTLAAACRTTKRKVRETLQYFAHINKLELAVDGNHIWWCSAIWHNLRKGKYSRPQLKSVCLLLKKWGASSVFQNEFEVRVRQLYVTKYGLVIPYADYTEEETEEETETEEEEEGKPARPIDRLDQWLSGNMQTVAEIAKNYGFGDLGRIEEIQKARGWIIANPRKGNKKNWPRFFDNWFKIAAEKRANKPPMTAAEEEAHYDGHRRRTGEQQGDFTSIGNVLDQIQDKGVKS